MLPYLLGPAGLKLALRSSCSAWCTTSGGDVQSAWVESAWFWHLVSEFAVRAEPPGEGCEPQDHCSEDGSVHPPVGRLGVPATSWRPDVLGIAIGKVVSSHVAWTVTGVVESKGARSRLLTELWDHHPGRLLACTNRGGAGLVGLTIVTCLSLSIGDDGLLCWALMSAGVESLN